MTKNKVRLSTFASALSTVFTVQAVEIETIEITATKRVESIQDVPMAVTALSANDLKNLKLRDTTEIASQIPNMQISTPMGDSLPVIAIRGISMDDFSFNQSSPVAVYMDEVYKGSPSFQSVQMFDLERLEVLRGPQGTIFGKNSTGGLISFISKGPSFDTGGYFQLGLGDNNRKEAEAAFGTELTDTLAVRVAGTWAEVDGWKENSYPGGNDANGVDEWGARVSFLYRPSDDLEVNLKMSASESTPYNYGYTAIPGPDGVGAGLYELFNNAAAGLPAMFGVTPPVGAPQGSYFDPQGRNFDDINADNISKRNVENSAVSLRIDYDISDEYKLTSITSYDKGEFYSQEEDGAPTRTFVGTYYSDAKQISQDLRVASNFNGDFNFIAGLYFSDEEVTAPTNLNLFQDLDLNVDGELNFLDCAEPLYTALGFGQITPNGEQTEAALNSFGLSLGDFAGLGCQLRNDYTQERTSLAAYFDGSYQVSETTTLRTGLRVTRDEAELKNFSAGYYGSDNELVAPTISQEQLPDDKIDSTEWTGHVGIDHKPSKDHMVYAKYSRGYRQGAFNGQAFNDPIEVTPVEPEFIDAYEVGFKSDLANNTFRINGALFYYDYQDQQFLDIDTNTAAQFLLNVDTSKIFGAELETTWAAAENLMLNAGLGWLDTEVDSGVVKGEDISGNELSQSPNLSLNAAIDYFQPLSTGELIWHIDANWVDEQYFDVQNTEILVQDAYAVANARLTYVNESSNYQLALWVKNITDKEYLTKPFDTSGFGMVLAHYGKPRTFGVEFMYNF